MDGSVSGITLSSYGRTGCGFLGVTCADNRGMLASRPLLCHLPSHVGCDPQDICCALLDCTALSLPLPVIHPLGVILASQLILLGYRDHIFQSWQEGCPSAGLGLSCSQGHTLPDLCDS